MRLVPTVALAFLALATACSSDGPSEPEDNELANGSFSARIDGQNFNANAAAVVSNGTLVSIGAGNIAGQTLGLAWIGTGTGTFAIGSSIGAVGTHTFTGKVWSASAIQGSGSIVVTTRTSNRVAGTFSFVLQADAASGATGTRTITQGQFDLTF
jgi:microcystin-dependent protein